jgi:thiaminase
MFKWAKSKRVVAQADRHCNTCRVTIFPGQRYYRDTVVNRGILFHWVQCFPCVDILGQVWEMHDDESTPIRHDYKEWAEIHIDDPELGEYAQAYKDRLGEN